MLIWRVVIAKIATLTELRTTWSFRDLIDANIILNLKEQMEQEQFDKIQADKK